MSRGVHCLSFLIKYSALVIFWYMKGEKVFITGGAGYIGSVLAKAFVALGIPVVVLDDLSGGYVENLPKEVTFYEESILSPSLDSILEKERPSVVFHLAGVKDVGDSLRDPVGFARVNVLGSVQVLEGCRRAGIKRVVFYSTAGVYGEEIPAGGLLVGRVAEPSDGYACSKLAVEEYMGYYNRVFGLEGIVLRVSNVYGSGGKSVGQGVIGAFIEQILMNKSLEVFGDGAQTRDFIYIKDLVDLSMRLVTVPFERLKKNFVLHASTGVETSVNDLIELLSKVVGRDIHVDYKAGVFVGKHRSVLSHKVTTELVGWKPKYGLLEGLGEMVK